MNHPATQRKHLEHLLIEKAMKDEAFLQRLIEKPKETIEGEYGIRLPDKIKITILREDDHTFYLVLPPPNAESEGGDLNEADLGSVSGGGDGYSIQGCEKTYALFCS